MEPKKSVLEKRPGIFRWLYRPMWNEPETRGKIGTKTSLLFHLKNLTAF
jgi:hypothetical protein